jgi:ATP-dependent helicase/nuclease subunit B
MGADKTTRRFLDWSRPALDQAAHFLTDGWKTGPLDLRDIFIVVPTRHAGRRLRERLAGAAAERNSAVLIGSVETASALFAPPTAGKPLTDPFSTQALWQRTLAATRPDSLTALFPLDTAHASAASAANAEHLARLRALLTEEGYTFTSFDREFGEKNPEPERWDCLARLETEYVRQVRSAGLRDDATEKIASARRPVLPDNTRRVVLLFVPDPPPLAIAALNALSDKVPVTVCVHAPEADADRFDAWGRPIPDAWEHSERPLRHEDVERCDDAAAMVEQIRRRIHELPAKRRHDMTIGVGTPDTAAQLRLALDRNGIPAFDPAGTPAANLPLFHIVRQLFALHREPTFQAFMALARLPEVLRRFEFLSSDSVLLEVLDDFQEKHLPATIEDARPPAARTKRWLPVAAAIAEVAEWRRLLDAQPLTTALPAVLARLYQGQRATEDLVTAAETLNGLLDRFSRIEPLCPNRAETMALFLRAMESQSLPSDRPAEAVDLLGWLELAWEDAPVLLLADMNDGLIPETVTGDPFLPDNARQTMTLRDNRMRFARDAHTLETILRCRPAGNVRLFVPRRNPRGDPLKPSRLLFQCADDELAPRALYLMADAVSPFAISERTPGWRVRPSLPDALPPITRVSVTGLRDFLACPFMFYLKRVLGMEPIEPIGELDAMAFGTVAHEAFEAFAQSEYRDTDDPALIERVLQGAVNSIFRERYGDPLALPLLVQRDLLLQRMAYAAQVQSGLRKENWRIVAGEQKFELPLGSLKLNGRIDRIDEHADGRLRVIDYKTTRDSSYPATQHLRKVTAHTNAQSWAFTSDGKRRWVDLQLPVYRRWCETAHKDRIGRIECAYFALPDAVTETAVLPWSDLDTATTGEAWSCAERIAARIAAGAFWPPQVNLRDDDPFRRLFFEDIVQHLDPAFVKAMEENR